MVELSEFLTGSLNVSDAFDDIGMQLVTSGGTKATVGAVASAAVKVADCLVMALSKLSSTVAPMAT